MLQLNSKPTEQILHGHVPSPDLQTHAQNFSRWKSQTVCKRQALSQDGGDQYTAPRVCNKVILHS